MITVPVLTEWVHEAEQWQRLVNEVWTEEDGSRKLSYTNCAEPDASLKGRIGEHALNSLLSSCNSRFMWHGELKTRESVSAGDPDFSIFVDGQPYGIDTKTPAGRHQWGLGVSARQLTKCLQNRRISGYIGGRWINVDGPGVVEFFGYASPSTVQRWPKMGPKEKEWHIKEWEALLPIERFLDRIDKKN